MILLHMYVHMQTAQTIKVTLFGDGDINQLEGGEKEHKTHYAQNSHLEIQ